MSNYNCKYIFLPQNVQMFKLEEFRAYDYNRYIFYGFEEIQDLFLKFNTVSIFSCLSPGLTTFFSIFKARDVGFK